MPDTDTACTPTQPQQPEPPPPPHPTPTPTSPPPPTPPAPPATTTTPTTSTTTPAPTTPTLPPDLAAIVTRLPSPRTPTRAHELARAEGDDDDDDDDDKEEEKESVFLLGTAHVSAKSCEDVRRLIRAVQPKAVFVELCNARTGLLKKTDSKIPTFSELVAQWRQGQANMFELMYGWFLEKVASSLEVRPGEEFRVALEEAQRARVGAFVLGDRAVQITVARAWASLTRWQRITLVYNILFEGLFLPDSEELKKLLEEAKETDVLTECIKELGQRYPTLVTTLLTERDMYMAHTLRAVAAKAGSVVAVVGAGHVQGIKANWDREIEVQELVIMPSESERALVPKSVRVLLWRVTTVAVTSAAVWALCSRYYKHRT